ncbi:alpha 1,2-mannosyltransferase 2.4.1 [Mortierella sp. AM989]|nr:alpha 1,2-mannosyltransferase 2.4.1 [Mortierella sp. AM989]
MIQAPSRYARIIRAVVPFAAICGLGYLFLITFVPAHFGPTAKIPMIKGRGGVEDSLINNIERVFVGEEFQESSQPNPYSEFSEIKKGSIYDNDLVLNAQRNIVVSEESYGYIGDDTGMMHKDKDQDIGIQSNDRNLDTQPHVHAGQEHRVESQEKQPTEKLPKLQKGYQHEQQYMDQTDKHSQLAKDQYILEDGPLLRNQQDQSLSNDGTFENDDDSDEEYLAMDAAQDTNLVNQGTLAEIYEVEKANGVLVILADEEGLQSARETIRQVEDRFNRDRNYPWVVLSPLPFTTRSQNLTKQLSKGAMSFGVVPHEQWRLPKWIDAAKIRNGDYAKMKLGMNKTSLLTRHKWRYMSGFVAQHELLDSYEFFWRIDPGVEIFCDVEEDPMLTLKRSAQKFAWSLSSTVNEAGVTGAWLIIQKIKGLYQNIIPAINNEAFLTKESQEEL